ncbi:DNA-binding protein [Nocardia nova]|nr:DNA-binding protein [Nocardia nova]
MNTEQASAYLGGFLAPQTLKNMRNLGIGPRSYRIGRSVVYDRADLDLYVAQQKAATLVGA